LFGATFDIKLWDVKRDDSGACVKLTEDPRLGLKTYNARPLDLAAVERLDMWVRQRHMEITSEACQGLPTAEKLEVLTAAAKNIALMTFTGQRGVELLGSVDGLTLVALCSIGSSHPNLTREGLRELLCLPENWQEVLKLLRANNNVEEYGIPSSSFQSRPASQKTKLTRKQRRAQKLQR
jgi:hypothetical protein